jgi:hypothetical protein
MSPFVNTDMVQNLITFGLDETDVVLEKVESIVFETPLDEMAQRRADANPWKAAIFVSGSGRVTFKSRYILPRPLMIGLVKFIKLQAEVMNRFNIESRIHATMQARAAKIAVPRVAR